MDEYNMQFTNLEVRVYECKINYSFKFNTWAEQTAVKLDCCNI